MVRFMKKQNQKTNNGSRQITVVAGNSFASFFLRSGPTSCTEDTSKCGISLFLPVLLITVDLLSAYLTMQPLYITSHAKHLVLFYIVAFARGSSKVRSTRHSTSCTIALASYS